LSPSRFLLAPSGVPIALYSRGTANSIFFLTWSFLQQGSSLVFSFSLSVSLRNGLFFSFLTRACFAEGWPFNLPGFFFSFSPPFSSGPDSCFLFLALKRGIPYRFFQASPPLSALTYSVGCCPLLRMFRSHGRDWFFFFSGPFSTRLGDLS